MSSSWSLLVRGSLASWLPLRQLQRRSAKGALGAAFFPTRAQLHHQRALAPVIWLQGDDNRDSNASAPVALRRSLSTSRTQWDQQPPMKNRAAGRHQNQQRHRQGSGGRLRRTGSHKTAEAYDAERKATNYSIGRISDRNFFAAEVQTHVLGPHAQPTSELLHSTLRNLAAPSLLHNMNDRVKAGYADSIMQKAFQLGVDLDPKCYDYYLRLSSKNPGAELHVPVHHLATRIRDQLSQPLSEEFEYTLLRAYALCGDVGTVEKMLSNMPDGGKSAVHLSQLIVAHGVNENLDGIMAAASRAGENDTVGVSHTVALKYLPKVGARDYVEKVFERLHTSGNTFRIGMLNNYIEVVATYGDMETLDKLYELKQLLHPSFKDKFVPEKQILQSAVFGNMNEVAAPLKELIASAEEPVKSIKPTITVLAERRDKHRFLAFFELLLMNQALLADDQIFSAIESAVIEMNDFELATYVVEQLRNIRHKKRSIYLTALEALASSGLADNTKRKYLSKYQQNAQWLKNNSEYNVAVMHLRSSFDHQHPNEIKSSLAQFQERFGMVPQAMWHAVIASAFSSESFEEDLLSQMREFSIPNTTPLYKVLVSNRLRAGNLSGAKAMAVSAIDDPAGVVTSTSIFAPILSRVVCDEGDDAGSAYLKEVLRLASRHSLRISEELLEGVIDGGASVQRVKETMDLLQDASDVELSARCLSKAVAYLASSGHLNEALDMAQSVPSTKLTSTAVFGLLSATRNEDGIVDEDAFGNVASVIKAENLQVCEQTWAAFLALFPSETRRGARLAAEGAFPNTDLLVPYMMEAVKTAKVEEITLLLLSLDVDQDKRRSIANSAFQSVLQRFPASGVKLFDELIADDFIDPLEGLAALAKTLFGTTMSTHMRASFDLIDRIVERGWLKERRLKPGAAAIKRLLDHANPLQAARVLKVVLTHSDNAHPTKEELELLRRGVISFVRNNDEKATQEFVTAMRNLEVTPPDNVVKVLKETSEAVREQLTPFLKLGDKVSVLGARAVRENSYDALADFVKLHPDALVHAVRELSAISVQQRLLVDKALDAFLQKVELSPSSAAELADALCVRKRGRNLGDQLIAIYLTKHHQSLLSEKQISQLNKLSHSFRLTRGDDSAVAEVLQRSASGGHTLSTEEYSKVFRSKFRDADFLLRWLEKRDDVCPEPWQDIGAVINIIFALFYHKNNADCMVSGGLLLEKYFPLEDAHGQPDQAAYERASQRVLTLHVTNSTRKGDMDTAVRAYSHLTEPSAQVFVSLIRGFLQNNLISQGMPVIDRFLANPGMAEKKPMILKELSTSLDYDGCSHVFSTLAQLEKIPVHEAFLQQHLKTALDQSAEVASQVFEQYASSSRFGLSRKVISDAFIDAALSANDYPLILEFYEKGLSGADASPRVNFKKVEAMSSKIAQLKDFRAMGNLIRFMSKNKESIPLEVMEHVVVDRFRMSSSQGDLDFVADALWQDMTALLGRPTKRVLTKLYSIWAHDSKADIKVFEDLLGTLSL